MTTTPPPRDPDTETLEAVVPALEEALRTIDTVAMGPSEQLATLAVAAVRGIVPMLRAELDDRLAREKA